MEKIAGVALVALFCIGTVAAFNLGIARQEIFDCEKWQAEAKELRNYYLLPWQADQCAAHNIPVIAPVQQYV